MFNYLVGQIQYYNSQNKKICYLQSKTNCHCTRSSTISLLAQWRTNTDFVHSFSLVVALVFVTMPCKTNMMSVTLLLWSCLTMEYLMKKIRLWTCLRRATSLIKTKASVSTLHQLVVVVMHMFKHSMSHQSNTRFNKEKTKCLQVDSWLNNTSIYQTRSVSLRLKLKKISFILIGVLVFHSTDMAK